MGQGLGPGFTTVATRRSVILSVDGLEFVLTFRCAACSAAASRDRSAPPIITAELLNRSRRPILPLRFNIAVFSSLSAGLTSSNARIEPISSRSLASIKRGAGHGECLRHLLFHCQSDSGLRAHASDGDCPRHIRAWRHTFGRLRVDLHDARNQVRRAARIVDRARQSSHGYGDWDVGWHLGIGSGCEPTQAPRRSSSPRPHANRHSHDAGDPTRPDLVLASHI